MVAGGDGRPWSIQLEIKPLKTKKKVKKPGAYRPSHIRNGKRVKNDRYNYIQVYTYKLRAKYSDKFIRDYGNNAKNRNWGGISCAERDYKDYLDVMEKAIKEDVKRMIRRRDGIVIRRDKHYIQTKYLFER